MHIGKHFGEITLAQIIRVDKEIDKKIIIVKDWKFIGYLQQQTALFKAHFFRIIWHIIKNNPVARVILAG